MTAAAPLARTPLHALHLSLGARMVPFAGYEMPVQYRDGVLAEHHHVRRAAGLFDVSHMGQALIRGDDPARSLERLVPGDILGLAPGAMRYSLLTDETGGILDDLMVAKEGGDLFLVVNAARKEADFAHLAAGLPDCRLDILAGQALLALQGPAAAEALAPLAPEAGDMGFMTMLRMTVAGIDCRVSRSGYTGEDGFEISVPASRAADLAKALLARPGVAPIGLGARDSLRLEAGLCLYGADIDCSTTPVEAGLAWTIGKRRRAEGGFPGAARILDQLAKGAARARVGVRPVDRAPARAHTVITDEAGRSIGVVTSGGFGPSLGGPLAMGYVEAAFARPGTPVRLMVRDLPRPAHVVAMPFVAHRYHKG